VGGNGNQLNNRRPLTLNFLKCPETGFLNRDCGRKPQVNLRSRARCSNSNGRGIQPDQWRALDLSLTGGLLPTVRFKESTSAPWSHSNTYQLSLLSTPHLSRWTPPLNSGPAPVSKSAQTYPSHRIYVLCIGDIYYEHYRSLSIYKFIELRDLIRARCGSFLFSH